MSSPIAVGKMLKQAQPQSNYKYLLTEHGQKTSAKHQLLVAVAENVLETYENIQQILCLSGTAERKGKYMRKGFS